MGKNVVLCIFGVVNRSIKYTWQTIHKHIVKHLEDNHYVVDIYVFNLICDNCVVDGKNVNTTDYKIIKANIYESKLQSELDTEIKTYISLSPHKVSYIDWYTDNQIHNTVRQMYSEYKVGSFLKKHINDYDYAIVCGPDYYLTQHVNIQHLISSKNDKCVYVSDVNPGINGYTNGYYMSNNLKDLSLLLCRYENILPYLNGFKGDYEQLLRKYCDSKNIKIAITDQVFFKIRANKTIFWQGFNESHKNDQHNKNEYKNVLLKFGLTPQTKFERR
jgi:hypothetical protein